MLLENFFYPPGGWFFWGYLGQATAVCIQVPDDELIQSWYEQSSIESGIASDPSLSDDDKQRIREWFRRILRDFREMWDDSTLPA